MQQNKLIELVATFRQNNPSFSYGQSDFSRSVTESLFLVEALVNNLRKNGVAEDVIEKSLQEALGARHSGQQLSSENRVLLAHRL